MRAPWLQPTCLDQVYRDRPSLHLFHSLTLGRMQMSVILPPVLPRSSQPLRASSFFFHLFSAFFFCCCCCSIREIPMSLCICRSTFPAYLTDKQVFITIKNPKNVYNENEPNSNRLGMLREELCSNYST